ncbi:MAG: hypothetical protein L0I62_08395 [Gammaproteobacteria bacterium]|nr:hypothetical protein [Gammaproteobacteria bacterium]
MKRDLLAATAPCLYESAMNLSPSPWAALVGALLLMRAKNHGAHPTGAFRASCFAVAKWWFLLAKQK